MYACLVLTLDYESHTRPFASISCLVYFEKRRMDSFYRYKSQNCFARNWSLSLSLAALAFQCTRLPSSRTLASRQLPHCSVWTWTHHWKLPLSRLDPALEVFFDVNQELCFASHDTPVLDCGGHPGLSRELLIVCSFSQTTMTPTCLKQVTAICISCGARTCDKSVPHKLKIGNGHKKLLKQYQFIWEQL